MNDLKEEENQEVKENKLAENGNGNGKPTFTAVAQLASTGVLLLGMFGLWWQQADPRARLDKIEQTQVDNRKEINDIVTKLRQELSMNFVSLREHNDLVSRFTAESTTLERKDESLLTKAQFEAWKNERDKLVDHIMKTIDELQSQIHTENDRMEKIKDGAITNPFLEMQTHRIDQLYIFVREIQQFLYKTPLSERNGK